MKSIQKLSLAAVMAMGMALSAAAATINITPSSNPFGPSPLTGNDNSNLSASQIQAIIGTSLTLTEVYKQDQGGPEGGSFASSYETSFDNSPNDPEDAFIDYISGNHITGTEIYLYVKDGNHDPAYYIFNISGWNGKDDLSLTGFWPGGGAISHLTILTGTGTSVPDAGSTVALLGASVGLLGFMRRKFLA